MLGMVLGFRYLWLSPKIAWPRQSSNCVRLCARLSLSLKSLDRPRTSPGRYSAQTGLWMRFGNVNQTSLLPLRSPFAIFDCIEDWLRRSPYASTVLEQVRDGIRLKRGFGCGSAMSIKHVCCHCAHLSLSLLFRYHCVRKVDAKGGI